jgi:hypothetical protein
MRLSMYLAAYLQQAEERRRAFIVVHCICSLGLFKSAETTICTEKIYVRGGFASQGLVCEQFDIHLSENVAVNLVAALSREGWKGGTLEG